MTYYRFHGDWSGKYERSKLRGMRAYGAHWSSYSIRLHNKWKDKLPYVVAVRQAMWERAMTVKRAKDRGLLYHQIGKLLGISKATVAIYLHRAERWRSRPSPIEAYFNERLDLRILAGLDKP